MAEFHGIEDSPVSMATVGMGLGLVLGPLGMGVGAAIGAIADVFIGAYAKKKARKQMKKDFLLQLLKRYNTQIFISVLERLGAAMIYVQELGLKPGSDQYDALLKKKLFSEIGYNGKCEIHLYGPAPVGAKRPLLAVINRHGKLTPYSPHIDINLGAKWAEACTEIHKAALKMWAAEQRDTILYKRERKKESEQAQRNTITRIMVNGGLILIMIGYTIKQKKKLKSLRQQKRPQKRPRPKGPKKQRERKPVRM